MKYARNGKYASEWQNMQICTQKVHVKHIIST